MRPSAFTDGNAGMKDGSGLPLTTRRFNEAVGFHRRKQGSAEHDRWRAEVPEASMRPSAFTDGNVATAPARTVASGDCFNEAVGFHRRKRPSPQRRPALAGDRASMRPSAFTDGNSRLQLRPAVRRRVDAASMRPSAFTDGNPGALLTATCSSRPTRFNEAVGFHRRKRHLRVNVRLALNVLQ